LLDEFRTFVSAYFKALQLVIVPSAVLRERKLMVTAHRWRIHHVLARVVTPIVVIRVIVQKDVTTGNV
ncbi:hypothetical protein PFISCL1PPCAC_922, partial [Pristionchus fissidentatus]